MNRSSFSPDRPPNLLIVGAGGVGSVAAQKAVEFTNSFNAITLASRSQGRLDAVVSEIVSRQSPHANPGIVGTRLVDARQSGEVDALIRDTGADIVVNTASPYCNTAIMDACLTAGAHYIDTAAAEEPEIDTTPAPWYANYEWPRKPDFAEKGLSALLGIGFDPGVVNIFCAHASKHSFDEIESIDIIDVNGGDHGRYFATNFNAETNLREIREEVTYWRDGAYRRIPPHSRKMTVDLPAVGRHQVYSMGHDELHSLPRAFPEASRIEFWMGFGERYLQVFEVLNRLGLLSSQPVDVEGMPVAPVKLVKAVLPDPASLAADYEGHVCIGCDIRGRQNGEPRRLFIYSTCDHRRCYEEVAAQAISYTTGVPVIVAALMLARGEWDPRTMVNMEELDPDPFLELMPQVGIDWHVKDLPLDGSWPGNHG